MSKMCPVFGSCSKKVKEMKCVISSDSLNMMLEILLFRLGKKHPTYNGYDNKIMF